MELLLARGGQHRPAPGPAAHYWCTSRHHGVLVARVAVPSAAPSAPCCCRARVWNAAGPTLAKLLALSMKRDDENALHCVMGGTATPRILKPLASACRVSGTTGPLAPVEAAVRPLSYVRGCGRKRDRPSPPALGWRRRPSIQRQE
ncbi:hypothetical protein Tc00.1047053508635.10 [Trypanosoma cruzi]|uniref:Uncharacterized protein n=1 Tax=Trypanosoma cruzi (strain CL Brener) TaxID=353153 RepID=Q4CP79_TRYCC|nr:hypothetical protein Tc00.1047053508635.10 [Trypanosoma cruzi]EAN82081.1 hypothetical protein Tc00.1047053508635.10 [Trypanosoma cruzi]|eukprot:XP_803932.1 hypothetical protein [Trypanosoma cruzi strain CL Brener]